MVELSLVFPLVVVAVVLFAVARRGAFRAVAVAAENLPAAQSASRHFRSRSIVATVDVLLFSAVFGSYLLVAIRATGPQTMMNPLHWVMLTPMLTGAIGIVAFAFVPHFREVSDSRSADLTRRTPFTFGPRTLFIAPASSVGVLIALILFFGSVSRLDGLVEYGDRGGYIPGFFYGVPLLIGVALLVGLTGLCVQRIASTPRPTDSAFRAADATVRLLSIRIVLNIVTAAVAATVGCILVWAGSTVESMSRATSTDAAGNELPRDAVLDAMGTWGHIGIWVGVACFIATVIFVVSALSDATRKPFDSAKVEPQVVAS